MSGKLIMKRKLDKEQQQELQPALEHELPTSTSARRTNYSNHNNDNDESSNDSKTFSSTISNPALKRLRCDTPPSENDTDELLPPLLLAANHENFINNQRNRHLLEAIQSKMLELQQELDEFEQDIEINEEVLYNNVANDGPTPAEITEPDAEALGYAMCAQETMLFLQREGIPPDSILYTRLRDALVGRDEQERAFRI